MDFKAYSLMNMVTKTFAQGKKNITLYLTLGYPNDEVFLRAVDILVEEGVDILELGIPVEKPYLDGEVVANSYLKVLNSGMNEKKLQLLLELIKSRHPNLPIVLMSYSEGLKKYNIIKYNRYFDALLSPDEILDLGKYNTSAIQIYNEELGEEEIKSRLALNEGFAYVMSGVGITGGTGELPKGYLVTMKRVRKYSNIPIQIGFAIHSREQVQEVFENGADGSIIGTQILRKLNEGEDSLREYVKEICKVKNNM